MNRDRSNFSCGLRSRTEATTGNSVLVVRVFAGALGRIRAHMPPEHHSLPPTERGRADVRYLRHVAITGINLGIQVGPALKPVGFVPPLPALRRRGDAFMHSQSTGLC